jgi:hypothetical protein
MTEILRNRCNTLVTALVGKKYVEEWWDSPNKRFDGETPRKVFDIEPNRVYNYLMEFSEGAW